MTSINDGELAYESLIHFPVRFSWSRPRLTGGTPKWTHLSSKTGDLPAPGTSTQQTGCLVLDIDKDGLNDIVVASRNPGARMVWYRAGQPAGRSTRSIAGSTSRPAALSPTSTATATSTSSSARTTPARSSTGGRTLPPFRRRHALGETRNQELGRNDAPRSDLRRLRRRRRQSAGLLGPESRGPLPGEGPAGPESGRPWPAVPIAKVGRPRGWPRPTSTATARST